MVAILQIATDNLTFSIIIILVLNFCTKRYTDKYENLQMSISKGVILVLNRYEQKIIFCDVTRSKKIFLIYSIVRFKK